MLSRINIFIGKVAEVFNLTPYHPAAVAPADLNQSPIAAVPQEVLIIILKDITQENFKAIRSVCRQLKSALEDGIRFKAIILELPIPMPSIDPNADKVALTLLKTSIIYRRASIIDLFAWNAGDQYLPVKTFAILCDDGTYDFELDVKTNQQLREPGYLVISKEPNNVRICKKRYSTFQEVFEHRDKLNGKGYKQVTHVMNRFKDLEI